jgi:hypothetical protein
MKMLMAVAGVSSLLLAASPVAEAQQCTRCSRQASVEACVQCSLGSSKAKQQGFSEGGIRRWCQQNQPACARKR